MVATLLSLKFRLVVADLKRSVGRLVVFIIFALYGLSMVASVLLGLVAASVRVAGHEQVVSALTIVVGAVIIVGWTLLPLVFFGADQTLDPARFRPFPLPGHRLAPGLVLAGIIGLPGLITAIMCVGVCLLWLGTSVVWVGVVAGLCGFVMTQLGCRIATTALSGSLSSRKARDLTGLIGLVVILLLGMGAYVISVGAAMWTSRGGGVTEVLATAQQVAEVLAWTPLGSPWAIMGAAGQGQWGMALVFFLLTVVYLIAGVRVYGAILNRALHASQTSASATEVGARNIVDSVTSWPGISGALVPVGAVMARALRYWRRDPRYLGQVPAVLMMPILFTFIGVSMPRLPDGGGQIPAIMSQGMIGFGLGFMALMAGYSLSADVASDSTAWWIHLASGVRGWQDRLGRILAQVMWMLPLAILVGVVVPLFVFDARVVPNVLGAMLVLYGAGLGVSAIFSALIIYPVALPGESPLKMKTGMMGTQMLSQFGSLFIGGIIALPLCIWAINAQGWQSWMVLGVSVLGFVTLTGLGVFFGGRIMDARGPAILSTLIKNDSKERS